MIFSIVPAHGMARFDGLLKNLGIAALRPRNLTSAECTEFNKDISVLQ